MTFEIPIQLRAGPNARFAHWRQKARRVKQERMAVRACAPSRGAWTSMFLANAAGRWLVTLVRVAPRRVDDDNLLGMLKGVRDEVASLLGVNDGSNLVRWRYAQVRGKPREHAVRVYVSALGPL